MNTQQSPVKSMGLNKKADIEQRLAAAKEVAEETNTPSKVFPKSAPQQTQQQAQQGPAERAAPQPPPTPASSVGNVHPLPAPPIQRKARGPKPALNRRFSVDLPTYLIEAIGDKAYKKKIKKRVVILNALKDAGFTVKDEDFKESTRDE